MKFFLIVLFSFGSVFCDELKNEVTEEIVTTLHKGVFGGKEIAYKAYTGIIPILLKEGKPQAGMFFISYIKDSDESEKRPISFCFNGGPGSSSIWLHMGAIGPKKVNIQFDSPVAPPYSYSENDLSLLEHSDLVFIDPISSGFSRPAPGVDAKLFHGYQEDLNSISDFIRIFISKYKRWDSPKYLIGESYGTLRAAALADHLHDEQHIYLNGIVMLSTLLNYQTILDYYDGNDLPYILSLPSFTMAAAYHNKLSPHLLADLTDTRHAAEVFALKVYGPALLQGDLLPLEERAQLVSQLSKFTGLSETFIDQSNLRISIMRFAKELLRDQFRTVGRFDSRYTGMDSDHTRCFFEYDPSFEAITGAFTATLNQYIRKDLGWEKTTDYAVLANIDWTYCQNGYLTVGHRLREAMAKNPNLKVFVGSGYYDLATPYFVAKYTFSHLNLDSTLRNNVTEAFYDGGHMMYTNPGDLKKLMNDLSNFYKNSIPCR